jgi:hypothetical protein
MKRMLVGFVLGVVAALVAPLASQVRTITTALPIAVLPVTIVPAIVTTEYLIAFQGAALDVYTRKEPALGVMSNEDILAVTRFNSSGIGVLRGTTPDTWTAVARSEWPAVRTRIKPYSGLSRWVDQMDAMLQ